jgi:hypothetical protein
MILALDIVTDPQCRLARLEHLQPSLLLLPSAREAVVWIPDLPAARSPGVPWDTTKLRHMGRNLLVSTILIFPPIFLPWNKKDAYRYNRHSTNYEIKRKTCEAQWTRYAKGTWNTKGIVGDYNSLLCQPPAAHYVRKWKILWWFSFWESFPVLLHIIKTNVGSWFYLNIFHHVKKESLFPMY